MRCDNVKMLLAEFTADALRPGLRSRVEQHLEACPACRAEHEALLKTMSLLESLPQAEPRRDLWAGVHERIRHPAPIPSLRPALARAALAVGLAGAIAFAAGRYVHQPQPPPVLATKAGPMAPYIRHHMELASTEPLADPANAGLLEAVTER